MIRNCKCKISKCFSKYCFIHSPDIPEGKAIIFPDCNSQYKYSDLVNYEWLLVDIVEEEKGFKAIYWMPLIDDKYKELEW